MPDTLSLEEMADVIINAIKQSRNQTGEARYSWIKKLFSIDPKEYWYSTMTWFVANPEEYENRRTQIFPQSEGTKLDKLMHFILQVEWDDLQFAKESLGEYMSLTDSNLATMHDLCFQILPSLETLSLKEGEPYHFDPEINTLVKEIKGRETKLNVIHLPRGLRFFWSLAYRNIEQLQSMQSKLSES